jgi:hypothetical protein
MFIGDRRMNLTLIVMITINIACTYFLLLRVEKVEDWQRNRRYKETEE